jgi:hypothetical protein
MNVRKRRVQAAIASAGAVILLTGHARATDLTGAWASDAGVCDKVFITKGNKTSFRQNSDLHGSGFIVEGHRIRGRAGTCNVVKTKMDAAIIHIVASCATDVMLSTQQLTFRVENENEITRLFPGLEDLEIKFRRCPMGKEKP